MKRIFGLLFTIYMPLSLSHVNMSAQPKEKDAKTSKKSEGTKVLYGSFEFVLRTIEGKEVRLRDNAGKVVLVNIWAPWCGPCRAETPGFVRVYDQFKAKGFEIISIAVNTDRDEVKAFVARYGIQWPVGISDEIAARYGTTGIPDNYLFGADGRLIKHFVGFTSEEDLASLIEQALKAPT